MPAIPTQSYQAEITSLASGATGKDIDTLYSNIKIDQASIRLNVTGAVLPTGFASNAAAAFIAGLADWTVTANFFFPSTPKAGNAGLVTYASGYAAHVHSWSMQLAAAVAEITEFAATGPTWRSYMPGIVSASGQYVAKISDTTPLTAPTAVGAAPSSATFKLTDESAADNTLAGSILAQQLGAAAGSPNLATYGYQVSGQVTAAGDSPLFPAGTIGVPYWEDDGTPDVTVSGKWDGAGAARTFSGKCFWQQVSVNVDLNGVVNGSLTLRGTGALTLA